MKIVDLSLTGLAGGTVEGGWAEELEPKTTSTPSSR